MRVDRYLVLVLSEEMNGINRSRVVLEVRHYELFEKTVRWFPSRAVSRRFSSCKVPHLLSELLTCFLDPLPNYLLNVLHVRDLQSLVRARIFRVLVITREVRYGAPSISLCVGGSRGKRRWWGSPRPLCPLIPSGLRLSKDLDLSDELILGASGRVSLRATSSRSRVTSAHCLPNYLRRFASIWRSWPSVGCWVSYSLVPASGGWGRMTFSDVFDENVGIVRMSVGKPRTPNCCRLTFWSGGGGVLRCALP